jgi:hypothetical protein
MGTSSIHDATNNHKPITINHIKEKNIKKESYPQDPALAKIEADNKRAAPMPEHVRKKIAQLKGGV